MTLVLLSAWAGGLGWEKGNWALGPELLGWKQPMMLTNSSGYREFCEGSQDVCEN